MFFCSYVKNRCTRNAQTDTEFAPQFFRHKDIRAYFYFHAKARSYMYFCSYVKNYCTQTLCETLRLCVRKICSYVLLSKELSLTKKSPGMRRGSSHICHLFKTAPSYHLRYTLPWWLSLRACQRGRRWFGVCRWWGR